MSGAQSFSQVSEMIEPLPDRIDVPGGNAHERGSGSVTDKIAALRVVYQATAGI